MTNRFNRYAVILCSLSITPTFAGTSIIVFDGSTGSNNENVAVTDNAGDGVYVIDSTDGEGSGSNLFHSFSDFNVDSGESAQFTDSTNSNYGNVILRVTGGNESVILGQISTDAALGEANLFLLNPNGVMFGAGASLNIGGAFYVSTADQLIFDGGQNQVMETGSATSSFFAAPVAAFGFSNPNPAAITVNDTNLKVREGKTLALIAGNIDLSGGELDQTGSSLNTLSVNNGAVQLAAVSGGGVVPVDLVDYAADELDGAITLSAGATIDTGGTSGGQIVIRGGSLTLNEGTIRNNIQITSNYTQPQAGIDIDISGDTTLNYSTISANSETGATSRSDGILIKTGNLSLSASTIESNMAENSSVANSENHQEGLINIITTGKVDVNKGSKITTINSGAGKSAAIDVEADLVVLSSGSLIDASANNENDLIAQGGDITINSDQFSVYGNLDTFSAFFEPTGIRSNGNVVSDTTSSGSITLNATNILVTDNGIIEVSNSSAIQGGDITLTADNAIEILNGGTVEISYAGAAGNISLKADSITVSGAVVDDDIGDHSRSSIENKSNISSATSGNILIESNTFELSNGARILTVTAQNESGGNIIISADDIDIFGMNEGIEQYDLVDGATPEAAILSAATALQAQVASLPNAGSSDNNASAGNIILTGQTVNISESAIVKTEYAGLADSAGNIAIKADNITVESNSLISTEQTLSLGANKPTGNISLEATANITIANSTLASKVNSADGSGGNISIRSNSLYLNDATLDSSANQGNGGNIRIAANSFQITPDTIINAHSVDAIDGKIEIQLNWQDDEAINAANSRRTTPELLRISKCDAVDDTGSSTLLIAATNTSNHFPQYEYILPVNNPHIASRNEFNQALHLVRANLQQPCHHR